MERAPRTAPHSAEAEKSVLGSMLISRDAVELSSEMLRPADFYTPAHQDIFSAMTELNAHGEAVDAVTVSDVLERGGRLAAAGGVAYITELSIFVPSAANIARYIHIVEERSVLRQLIRAGGDIVRDAPVSHDRKAGEPAVYARSEVFDISLLRAPHREESVLAARKREGALLGMKKAFRNAPPAGGAFFLHIEAHGELRKCDRPHRRAVRN